MILGLEMVLSVVAYERENIIFYAINLKLSKNITIIYFKAPYLFLTIRVHFIKQNFFRNYTLIIIINNDGLNCNETYPSILARNPIKSKMSP